MLLDEDPAALIRHTITNFNIAPDRAALARISDSLSTLQQSRDIRTRNAESALRKLSRQCATLSSQHKEVICGHDSSRHASEIVELDTRKFRIAKQASELEVESERLGIEQQKSMHRLAELEDQGVEGDQAARRARQADDPIILRLWLYRSLGITLEQNETGGYKKATIRNTKKGDVHLVNIDPRYSKWHYADYLWQTMEG